MPEITDTPEIPELTAKDYIPIPRATLLIWAAYLHKIHHRIKNSDSPYSSSIEQLQTEWMFNGLQVYLSTRPKPGP